MRPGAKLPVTQQQQPACQAKLLAIETVTQAYSSLRILM